MDNPSAPEVPNLDQAIQNFKRIEQAGYESQESGQQLVRFGKAGQEQAHFLSKEIPKYAVLAQQYPSLQTPYDSFKEWSAFVVKKSQEAVTNVGAGTNLLSSALSAASSAVTAGNTPTLNFLSGVYQIQGRESKNIIEVHRLQKPTDPIAPDNEKELNERLARIDTDLLNRRRGAWDAFYSVSADRLSQAAHSLRDVLRSLISRWVSNDQVKKALWWKPVPNTRDGVSTRQRIQLLLYGSSALPQNPVELSLIESEVSKFTDDNTFLNSIAHGGSSSSTSAGEFAMKSIDNLILLILRTRTQYHQD
jgi:Predicted pPIWI-associating nuclease